LEAIFHGFTGPIILQNEGTALMWIKKLTPRSYSSLLHCHAAAATIAA
jgi:hypothetical protein